MNRRKFIHSGIGAAAAVTLAAPGSVFAPPRTGTSPAGAKFKLRYAPASASSGPTRAPTCWRRSSSPTTRASRRCSTTA